MHRDAPFLLKRKTLSYLRGPMTRDEIRRLGAGSPTPAAAAPASAAPAPSAVTAASATSSQPVLPPDVPQAFWPVRSQPPAGDAKLVYTPLLAANVTLRFTDTKTGTDASRREVWIVPPPAAATSDPWPESHAVNAAPDATSAAPAAAAFAAVPAAAAQAKSYDRWMRQLVDWLYRNATLALWRSADPRLVSQPGESERDFRIRLADAGREARDARSQALRAKYAPRLERLRDQVRRAEQAQERESQQAQQQKVQTAVSVGATLLGAFLGGGRRSSVGRATTAARSLGRTRKEAGDVARAETNLATVQAKLQALDSEFASEVAGLEKAFDAETAGLETLALRPKKADVVVHSLQLVWAPSWLAGKGGAAPAWE